MAYRYYHGRTGVIWNVTKGAVGVMVNKLIGNRIRRKKIHVRIEHIRKSKCRDDFLARVKVNDAAKAATKKDPSLHKCLKRKPFQPRPGGFVKVADTEVKFLEIPVAVDRIK